MVDQSRLAESGSLVVRDDVPELSEANCDILFQKARDHTAQVYEADWNIEDAISSRPLLPCCCMGGEGMTPIMYVAGLVLQCLHVMHDLTGLVLCPHSLHV